MNSEGTHSGRMSTTSWIGRSGFERLLSTFDARVAEPTRFRAEERRYEINGMELIDWRSSPMTLTRHARPGTEARTITFTLVASGRVRFTRADESADAGAGTLFLTSGAERTRIDMLEASHLFLVRLPVSQLPAHIRLGEGPQSGVVEPSIFTPGFITLIRSLIGRPDVEAQSLHGAVALRALAAAVLMEQFPTSSTDMGSLRRQMVLHIELHLADPDLGPRSIAAAFGVSLRWVHVVFNTGDVSVARFIRECRADAVAAAVRSDRRLARVSSLASAYGFGGRDQLNRAFRARYGVSLHEYQELVDRGEPLPAPADYIGSASEEHVASRTA